MRWENLKNATMGELVEEMIDQKLSIRDLQRQRETLIYWEDAVRRCRNRINEIATEISERESQR